LMDHLIRNGTEPKRVFYLQLDDTTLNNVTSEPLGESLDVFSRYIIKESLGKLSGTVYVFLDEIQYLEDWAQKLKTIFDRKYNIKFFISGSSSTEIYEASDPLQGRMSKRIISTLKFSDFAGFYLEKDRPRILDLGLTIRDGIKAAMEAGDARGLYERVMEGMPAMADIEDELRIRFNDYLIRGGYPALLKVPTYAQATKLLKDSLELSIHDIEKRYQVRNPGYFEKILFLLSDVSSKNVSFSSISRSLGIDKITIAEYIEYLKRTYIISISRFFSRSGMKRLRKDYKIHMNDVGLRNSVLSYLNENLLHDRAELGKVMETCTFNHAQRLQFFLSGYDNIDVGYTEIGGKEIDIIISYGKHTLPIEVKLDGTRSDDESALNSFMRYNGLKLGIIITEKTLKLHGDVLLLPGWLFALCC